jgi:hypothetical protein
VPMLLNDDTKSHVQQDRSCTNFQGLNTLPGTSKGKALASMAQRLSPKIWVHNSKFMPF